MINDPDAVEHQSPDRETPEMRVLESFPVSQERAYEVHATRVDGERELSQIAARSDREYIWTFDNTTETWRHHVGEHRQQMQQEGDRVVSVEMGMTIPRELHTPVSPDTTMYHIHPKTRLDDESSEVKNQLPSNADFDACAKLGVRGYKDFRIVTPLGVTVMELDMNAVSATGEDRLRLQGFTLTHEDLTGWIRTLGAPGAAQKAVDEMSDRLDGIIRVSFEAMPAIE